MASDVRVDGRRKVRLDRIDPNAPKKLVRAEIEARTVELGRELADLEDLLFFAGQHAVLVVLQGRDTAGKDGTIRTILDYCNVQSLRVESFKVPTAAELAHDFLWRVHARTPGHGELVIFNRSHYEDVLVVRVHELVPKSVWKARYDAINQFESLLGRHRTLLFKFYLHIDKAEQKARLIAREAESEKAWKLAVGDWKERERWDDYTEAYEAALSKCASDDAPWHVVPANQKWYRDFIVLGTLVEGLRPYKEGWLKHLSALGRERRGELEAFRAAKAASREKSVRPKSS
ncbi:MAG: PPK2 family polyphosphate kinase [Vicinamibacterales bacterium]